LLVKVQLYLRFNAYFRFKSAQYNERKNKQTYGEHGRTTDAQVDNFGMIAGFQLIAVVGVDVQHYVHVTYITERHTK
jgi:hypothetical protein